MYRSTSQIVQLIDEARLLALSLPAAAGLWVEAAQATIRVHELMASRHHRAGT